MQFNYIINTAKWFAYDTEDKIEKDRQLLLRVLTSGNAEIYDRLQFSNNTSKDPIKPMDIDVSKLVFNTKLSKWFYENIDLSDKIIFVTVNVPLDENNFIVLKTSSGSEGGGGENVTPNMQRNAPSEEELAAIVVIAVKIHLFSANK